MITLNEYLTKRNQVYKKVYEILKDDTGADVVYELQAREEKVKIKQYAVEFSKNLLI